MQSRDANTLVPGLQTLGLAIYNKTKEARDTVIFNKLPIQRIMKKVFITDNAES